MRNCVYRFLNKDNEVTYIGRAKDLKQRLNNHNHLPKECYDERVKIEYIEFDTEDDMNFAERYYIMNFNPKYNTMLSDKDFNLKSIELDMKRWKVYLKNVDKEFNFYEEVESIESLLEELKEVRIRINTLKDFDMIRSEDNNEIFNKKIEYLLNKEDDLKNKSKLLIKNMSNKDVPEWCIDEFIDNGVLSIKDLIKLKIDEIRNKYYKECEKQILQYGYYREDLYESIDLEFVCTNTNWYTSERWKTLLEGSKVSNGLEAYRINKILKNKIVTYIIESIEHSICLKYGEIEREIIILDSYAEGMKAFYPNYNYMTFKKPFVVYKVA